MKKPHLLIAAAVMMTACTFWQLPQILVDNPPARTEAAVVGDTNTPLVIAATSTAAPPTVTPPLVPSAAPFPTSSPVPPVITPTPFLPTPIPPTPLPPTVTPPPVWVNALYLGFEHGFMAYVEGSTCLYAYAQVGILIPDVIRAQEMGHYRYCTEFNGLPDAPEGSPEGNFGRVWSYYAEMQAALGAPLGAVVYYTTTIPPSEPVVMGGVFYSGMITLPDAQALYCGTRGATAGQCELRSGQLPY